MAIEVKDWIRHGAALYPARLAMVDMESGRHITYAAFHERAERLADALASKWNVRAGDRVAILAHSTTDIFELQMACLRIGAVLVPMNWRLAEAELRVIGADCAPKVLFADGEFASKAVAAAGGCVVLSIAYGRPSDYEEAIAQAGPREVRRGLGPDDPWIILYTSGTTGAPKGVIITYRMVLFNIMNMSGPFGITARSRGVTFLPTFHIGGFNAYANALFFMGGATYVPRAFDAKSFFDLHTSKTIGITHSGGVPAQLQMMAEQPGFSEADLSHIEVLAVGGAAVPDVLIETYARKGVALNNAWGMTETAGMTILLRTEDAPKHAGSCGQKALFVDTKVVDKDGLPATGDAVGELLVRGPTITPGFWNNSKASEAAFTDGWLKTGDAVRVDEHGYYTIVDRWKDMFISGGENIYPAEIENVIAALPWVRAVAVVGLPHEKWGEVGCAFIAIAQGAEADSDIVIEHCRANLARYKTPAQVRFVEDLPRNASGKVLKHVLRAMLLESSGA